MCVHRSLHLIAQSSGTHWREQQPCRAGTERRMRSRLVRAHGRRRRR